MTRWVLSSLINLYESREGQDTMDFNGNNPNPPHAFVPWSFSTYEMLHWGLGDHDCWNGSCLRGNEYFVARNNIASLVVAAQTGNLDLIQTLLSSNTGIDINQSGLEGETALHMSSALGYVDIVVFLLASGADSAFLDRAGCTPLMHCARFCSGNKAVPIAKALIESGGYPKRSEADFSEMQGQQSVLNMAISARNIDLINYLLTISDTSKAIKQALEAYKISDDEAPFDCVFDHGVHIEQKHIQMAIQAGAWGPLDHIISKLGLFSPEIEDVLAFDEFIYGPSICMTTREGTYIKPGCALPEIFERLITKYNLDPNHDRVRYAIIAVGNKHLLDFAFERGLDTERITDKDLEEALEAKRDTYHLDRRMCIGLDPRRKPELPQQTRFRLHDASEEWVRSLFRNSKTNDDLSR